jgi:hypothetical protein
VLAVAPLPIRLRDVEEEDRVDARLVAALPRVDRRLPVVVSERGAALLKRAPRSLGSIIVRLRVRSRRQEQQGGEEGHAHRTLAQNATQAATSSTEVKKSATSVAPDMQS